MKSSMFCEKIIDNQSYSVQSKKKKSFKNRGDIKIFSDKSKNYVCHQRIILKETLKVEFQVERI